jgi:hypothetical protein
MRSRFSIVALLALSVMGCAHVADDGLPAPQTGERYLHDQFARARARMAEPYILGGEDVDVLLRTFSYQLRRLGDERFALALSKEAPDVIAAVGGFIGNSARKENPRTDRVLRSVPSILFPAVRITDEDAKRE